MYLSTVFETEYLFDQLFSTVNSTRTLKHSIKRRMFVVYLVIQLKQRNYQKHWQVSA